MKNKTRYIGKTRRPVKEIEQIGEPFQTYPGSHWYLNIRVVQNLEGREGCGIDILKKMGEYQYAHISHIFVPKAVLPKFAENLLNAYRFLGV